MDASRPEPDELKEVALGSSGLRAWQVNTASCRALVSRQGAQVLEFQASGKRPLLWLSEQAQYQPGKAIRGGIPLCFPWFGPHPDDAGKPAHGFARLRDWELVQAEKLGEVMHLHFQLQSDAQTRALWPQDFRALLTMTLGRALALQLQVENTGHHDFRFSFAFHSYFPVSDIHEARVEGLEGTPFLDQLHPDRAPAREDYPLHFHGETDRIYLHTPSRYCILDERLGQAIRITAQDCRSAVVWNPWEAKAARLADMRDEAWRHMLCVEPGNVADDAVTLPAGASKVFSILLEGEA